MNGDGMNAACQTDRQRERERELCVDIDDRSNQHNYNNTDNLAFIIRLSIYQVVELFYTCTVYVLYDLFRLRAKRCNCER